MKSWPFDKEAPRRFRRSSVVTGRAGARRPASQRATASRLSCAASALTRMSMRLWSGVAMVYTARLPTLRTSVVGSPCEKPRSIVTGYAAICPESVATRISRPSFRQPTTWPPSVVSD